MVINLTRVQLVGSPQKLTETHNLPNLYVSNKTTPHLLLSQKCKIIKISLSIRKVGPVNWTPEKFKEKSRQILDFKLKIRPLKSRKG